MSTKPRTEFPCTRCGACCRVAAMLPGFPEPTTESGRCVHLTGDDLCSIYEDRPEVCRINAMWEKQNTLTLREYHRVAAATCNDLMRAQGMDESKRVILPEVDP